MPRPSPRLLPSALAGAARPLRRWLAAATALLVLGLSLTLGAASAAASLENDRYDGNIFALYAGNGSLVPPRSTLAETLEQGRVAVLVYYLDDSSVSKRFAPVVSELQRLWGNAVELIPLVTDPLQERGDGGVTDPAHYWKGTIPQVVVLDGQGHVRFDASGQVDVDAISESIAAATGVAPRQRGASRSLSFNELNREVVSQP